MTVEARTSLGDPVLGLLAMEIDSEAARGEMVVGPLLLNTVGGLWGGVGLAAAVAAGEAVLGRGCLWATVQYIRPILLGSRIELEVEVGQHGRGLSQVAVRGTVAGRLALLATGSFGGGGGPHDVSHQFARALTVPPPEDCPARVLPEVMTRNGGMITQIEQRMAVPPRETMDGTPGHGRTVMWLRSRHPIGMSPAALAVLADMMPGAVAEAVGRFTIGLSLDNTIRVGRAAPPTPQPGWVLLDAQVEAIVGGIAHLTTRMFDTAGHLLATASQSARLGRPRS